MNRYVLIAGVNGAGKSTLYQTLDSLKEMERINTDEIVRSFGDWRNVADVIKSGKIAVRKINEYFGNRLTFNQETTLCGTGIVRNIDRARKLGYEIHLHYVGVDTVEIAKKRIAYRVEHGGHGISDADVERRYVNSLNTLKTVIGKCDLTILYDNTVRFDRFAIFQSGKCTFLSKNTPKWYDNYFGMKG